MKMAALGRHSQQLTPLDTALWGLDSVTAPMHVGWVAELARPEAGPRPTFEQLRAHIDARLMRAARFRQRVVLTQDGPVWADDEHFDIAHHVRRTSATDLGALADEVLSRPLLSYRPLWELWIADRLDDGHMGIVGKTHHGLLDGFSPTFMALRLDCAAAPAREPAAAREPRPHQRIRRAHNEAHVLATAALPLAPPSPLNGPLSFGRHLAYATRPLENLRIVERRFATTINDVLLAASAVALRELLLAHGRTAVPLKAMVPVSVRGAHEQWGNRIAAVFAWLPCDEPDAERRLAAIHAAMRDHKRRDVPAADAMLGALAHAARPLRSVLSRALSSPRMFNLTISNVPGPAGAVTLMGCEVTRAYPAVPLASGHRVSIGMTSVNGHACFSVLADSAHAAHADQLARDIGAAMDELLDRCAASQRPLGSRVTGP
jgi:diacylglycerol O-acyltransferase / wax synthase